MSIIICPGIHPPEMTTGFLAGVASLSNGSNFNYSGNILIFPTQDYLALSTLHIVKFLGDVFGGMPCDHATQTQSDHRLASPPATPPLIFISFSAGVVGAIGSAWTWQLLGGKVKAFIALDGWGVPLFGNFPIHRLSHDFFTHWSSAGLGSGEDSFYADPAVEHLELWRSPQTIQGWWIHSPVGKSQPRTYLTAAQFLTMLLERYGEGQGDKKHI